ncbi:DUF4129 domain-containing protein [Gracilibacillus thailandensis]|uniref:DUF4129 domain-containing protein n=1 Tax=Gracilibacillus thailandensis TaxID=563735 RepID=A0A6N7QYA3_9BACI|nr:DUF4129 domain-containing protein [Gracilibacillus thailandensis]MRI67048.1 hypothetical protein [Gracilibacillus thailandensis]
MPAKLKQHIPPIMHGVIEFIGFFPVFLIIGILVFAEPDLYYWFLSLLLLFTVSYFVRCWLNNRGKVLISAAVITMIISWSVSPTIWAFIPGLLFSLVISYRGIQHAENEWQDILPSRIFWAVSMPVYFVGYLVFINIDSLEGYQHWISYPGFLFIIIMLFITNQEHLHKESLAKDKQKKMAPEIIKLNRVYLIITLLVVFAITNFQVVQSALYHGVRSIIQSIMWLASLSENDNEIIEEPQQANEMPAFPTAEEQEPSRFAELMDALTYIMGLVLVAILILLFIAILFKKFRRLLIRAILSLWRMIQQVFGKKHVAETATDYQDEKENLFDWKKWRKENQEKITEAFRQITKRKPKFERLTNEEKVRFLYRRIARDVKKQEKWRESLTAHEVLALTEKNQQLELLETLYDNVRYGKGIIRQDNLQQLQEIWRYMNFNK